MSPFWIRVLLPDDVPTDAFDDMAYKGQWLLEQNRRASDADPVSLARWRLPSRDDEPTRISYVEDGRLGERYALLEGRELHRSIDTWSRRPERCSSIGR